jgi:ketosteroid isomerase-like protein
MVNIKQQGNNYYMNPQDEIRQLLQTFQDGYIRRDVSQVDSFMELFTTDAEIIGTNGVKPGVDEWYLDRASARELVEGDWQGWGDLRLDLDSMSVHSRGDTGWVAASATVTQIIGTENYASYLEFVKKFLDDSRLSAEQKLLYILRGGTNTIYELRRGEKFVWALRFTAVLIRERDGWKFAQMNFSFPTVYFPDVRLFD